MHLCICFTLIDPPLFNMISGHIKEETGALIYKENLDKFLQWIQDKPTTFGYISANSYSLLNGP